VPEFYHRLLEHVAEHVVNVFVAVGTGKNNNAKFHRRYGV
jgi:hypothetical protein